MNTFSAYKSKLEDPEYMELKLAKENNSKEDSNKIAKNRSKKRKIKQKNKQKKIHIDSNYPNQTLFIPEKDVQNLVTSTDIAFDKVIKKKNRKSKISHFKPNIKIKKPKLSLEPENIHTYEETNKKEELSFNCYLTNITTYSKINDVLIIFLKKSESVAISGCAIFQCLFGSVEIFGKLFEIYEKELPIYSPSCHPRLTINDATTSFAKASKAVLKKSILKCIKEIRDEDIVNVLDIFDSNITSVFILRNHTTQFIDFVSRLNPFEDLFMYSSGLTFQVGDLIQSEVYFTVDSSMIIDEFVHEHKLNTKQVILLCGGKGSGKSTMCRYVTNKFLNILDEVAYLDCDIGQTEFQPPGFIGLNLIKKPLIGPGFTHPNEACNVCFVGHVSPAFDPLHYLNCLKLVFSAYLKDYSHLPLIVNTMGWNRDIGVSLLIHTIHLVKPSVVIQLDSVVRKTNLPNISTNFVLTPPTDYLLLETIDTSNFVNYKHFIIPSNSKSNLSDTELVNLSPRDFRDIMLLSHLFITSPTLASIEPNSSAESSSFLASATPEESSIAAISAASMAIVPLLNAPKMRLWRICLEDVALHVCHQQVSYSNLLLSVNCRVCSLCHVDENIIVDSKTAGCPKFLASNPVCLSFGLGIIKSIDMVEHCLYVLTNVSATLLRETNCLLVGGVELPRQLLLLDQKLVAVDIPYVSYTTDGFGVAPVKAKGLIVPRKRM